MSTRPSRCVLDASAAIQLFLPEPESDRVQQLVALQSADPPLRMFVPGLLFAECANAMWKARRSGRVTADVAGASVAELLRIGLEWLPTFGLVQHALELASDLDVSVYDACYLAAAGQMQAVLITADQRLASRSKASGIATSTLREIDWLDEAR